MPGLKVTLPLAFTDTTLPIVTDDLVLSAGSLFMVDPSFSLDPMANGIPTSDTSNVPNLAWQKAAAMLGITADATAKTNLRGILRYGATYQPGAGGTKGLLERTPKGGIHVVCRQSVAHAVGDGADLRVPSTILAYINANKSHAYYYSQWQRITRVTAINTRTVYFEIGGGSTGSDFQLAMLDIYGGNGIGTSGTSGYVNYGSSITGAGGNSLGTSLFAAASTCPTPSGGNWAKANSYWGTGAGNQTYNSATLGAGNQRWPSYVLYRTYIEDLTVSGRTYGQVQALDAAAFAAAFATGGRYNGDTVPTDPATAFA